MAKKIKSSDKYKLPKVEYPKLELPANPVGAAPNTEPRLACNGEVEDVLRDWTKSPIPPPKEGIKRVLIGIPVLTYSHEFIQNFLSFWTKVCNAEDAKYECGYHFVHRKPVHMAQQAMVEIALYNKCTHILFMDDDIWGVGKEQLDMLLAADKDVIAGVMYASKFPYAQCVFRRYDTKKKVIDMPVDNSMYRLYEVAPSCEKCSTPVPMWGEFHCPKCGTKQNNVLQKADLIPFCFTLMKMDIFKKIKKPWFHCTSNYPADSWFSDRCIEAGIQQWGHMGVRLTHAGVNDLTKRHHFDMGLATNRAKDKGLVQLSSEEMDKHQFMLSSKMKEAEEKLKNQEVPIFINAKASNTKEKRNECKKSGRDKGVQRKKSIQKKHSA